MSLTYTSKLSSGCKVRTAEEPSLSKGWATYAWANPVVRRSSYEQKTKETYKHPTCWLSSSTTSTAWWWTEDGDYDEDDAHVMGVRHRVLEEIRCVRWMEHIYHDHVHEIHMPDDSHQCLWKRGCSQSRTPMLCSLKCRIRAELYEFLIRLHPIIDIVDDIDM
jgi:hypothetical protein